MKNLFIGIVISLIFHSCYYTSIGRHHYNSEQLNRRIERRIKHGMKYNHKKINQEKTLKLKTLNNK
jgi:hypothetical protein